MLRGEVAIEASIVGYDNRVPDKFHQPRQGLGGQRGVDHIAVMDISQMRHILRDGFPRVHEGDVPVNDLAALHASGGDLSQLVVIQREARGLGVQNHNVSIKGAEMPRSGANGQRLITLDHILRGTIGDEVLQLSLNGRGAACHAFSLSPGELPIPKKRNLVAARVP